MLGKSMKHHSLKMLLVFLKLANKGSFLLNLSGPQKPQSHVRQHKTILALAIF